MEKVGKIEKATFGAGCFWGVEEAFSNPVLRGIKKTEVGFMGGNVPSPSYEDVCRGKTGHIEVVKIYYNSSEISYEELLKVFWSIGTQVDRQGHDVGHQYRSVIFFHTPEQEHIAKKSKAELEFSRRYPMQIVTQILPVGPFYRAEEYHQQYFKKHGLCV